MKQVAVISIYGLSTLLGLLAFADPFLRPVVLASGGFEQASYARTAEAPMLTVGLLLLCLTALFVEMQGQATNVKMIAALGVLVAITAVLRFLETAVAGPGGFSPVFVPIILTGYVFGSRFGFLMGALSLLVSALLTGGVGPWLPFQMFSAGWIGLTAGWLPHLSRPGLEMGLLILFGLVWGLLYGAIINLYFWPFFVGEAGLSWQVGDSWQKTVAHYAAFYLATSLVWDIFAALGNGLLLLALGRPVLQALNRFQTRFQFQVA